MGNDGEDKLQAYQVEGETAFGEMGWRLFELEKIRDVKILERQFEETRFGYELLLEDFVMIYEGVGGRGAG
jgi:hypothetical protein